MANDSVDHGSVPPTYTTSLMSGALAGLSVDLLFYPIDTLKTRLQSSQGFWQAGGFKGIYRGIESVAVGSAPGAAVFFVTYETLKPLLLSRQDASSSSSSSSSTASAHMIAASVAEVAACLIRVPTEVIKSRQQTSAYGIKTSSFKAFQSVIQEAGVRGLYTGYASTVGREIPFTCIQFPLYEQLKLLIARSPTFQRLDASFDAFKPRDGRSIPTWQAGLAGSVAGSFAAGITTPLDVVKTRIMLQRRGKAVAGAAAPGAASSGAAEGVNVKMIPTLRHIFATEGVQKLFSGFLPRTIWIGLGGFVFLGTFEAGVKVLQGTATA